MKKHWRDASGTRPMPTIIDGYNLLSAVGIVGPSGPGNLERARLALLNFLAESLDPKEVRRTTVVFDAADPPPGLPRTIQHRGLTVRFASQYDEADTLIEELIAKASAPRRLTVVSSDHRLKRAAKRRRATPVDSDVWYDAVVCQRRERLQAEQQTPARPLVPLLEEDVNYWIGQFGGESALMKVIEEELAREAKQSPDTGQPPGDKPTPDEAAEFDDVFPPGYGEDLLEDDN